MACDDGGQEGDSSIQALSKAGVAQEHTVHTRSGVKTHR